MNEALVIVVAIALLSRLLGSLLQRFGSPRGLWLSFGGHTLLHLTVAVVFVGTAVVIAGMGGWFIALAVVPGVLAACGFALAGLTIWGLWRFGVHGDE